MSFSIVLDVVIGLSLVYLSASLFVTVINEYISRVLKLRSRQLVSDLGKLIGNSAMLGHLDANPALRKFFEVATPKNKLVNACTRLVRWWLGGPGTDASSYVDTKVLAQQLIGGLTAEDGAPATLSSIITALEANIANNPQSSALEKQLLAVARSTDKEVETLIDNVSSWADQSLTMMGEAYKKRMQVISLLVGFGVAAALNVDTLSIVSRLWTDQETRTAIASYATDFVAKVPDADFMACLALSADSEEAKKEPCKTVRALATSLRAENPGDQNASLFAGLPIGYPLHPVWATTTLQKVFTVGAGWLLTTLATSLGAPFWFDLLSRVTNVRQSMRKPEEQT
jgi:hypothetical protein